MNPEQPIKLDTLAFKLLADFQVLVKQLNVLEKYCQSNLPHRSVQVRHIIREINKQKDFANQLIGVLMWLENHKDILQIQKQ